MIFGRREDTDDLDSLIHFLTTVREKYGNMPIGFDEENGDGPILLSHSGCSVRVFDDENFGPQSRNGDWWEKYGNRYMNKAPLPVLMIQERY